MSQHDDLFAEFGAPLLMEHFGDAGFSLYCEDRTPLAEGIQAIAGPIGTVEQIENHVITNVDGRRIDVYHQAVTGIEESHLAAYIKHPDGTLWDITEIEETETMLRFLTVRHEPTRLTRDGFYADQ